MPSAVAIWRVAAPPAAFLLGWGIYDQCLLISTGGAEMIPGLLSAYVIAVVI